MKLLEVARLALLAYVITALTKLEDRIDEIDNEIDRLGIDAVGADMLRIVRLNRERGRKAKLLKPLRSAVSGVDPGA